MSHHRHRAPTYGIHRRTRLNVVDNSEIGRKALMSGRPAYCFDVLGKGGRRRAHMPKGTTGDKLRVAVAGESLLAICVGAKLHPSQYKSGQPSFDTNNVVLLDRQGNLLGTRILAPIPSWLRAKASDPMIAKLLAIATKFV